MKSAWGEAPQLMSPWLLVNMPYTRHKQLYIVYNVKGLNNLRMPNTRQHRYTYISYTSYNPYNFTKMPSNTKHKHFCKYIPYTAPVEFYVYAIYNINI